MTRISNSLAARNWALCLCAVVLSMLSACSGASIEQATMIGAQIDLGTNINAYRSYVYPILRKNCATCHGTAQTPLHAQDDAALAYEAAMIAQIINTEEPSKSLIVTKVSEKGHNCWSSSCAADGAALSAAIEQWLIVAGDEAPDTNGSGAADLLFTEEVEVPLAVNNIASSTGPGTEVYQPQTMEIPLESVSGVANTFLRFDIQRISTHSYLVSDLAIKATAAPSESDLFIKLLKFQVNQSHESYEHSFDLVETVVPIVQANDPAPFTALSSLIGMKDGPGVDKIRIGFQIISPVTNSQGDPALFAEVLDIIENNCLSCHGVGDARGEFASFDSEQEFLGYTFPRDDASNLTGSGRLVMPNNPDASNLLLWLEGAPSRPPMPRDPTKPAEADPAVSDSEREAWAQALRDWINSFEAD